MSLVVDEHRQYLSDSIRLEAFRRAIQHAVRPGDVVVDLGSGTGILGLFACQAGARRVYSIEYTDIVELGRALAAANRFESRITFLRDCSLQVDLPERADVIVADQIGQFGFEAGLWEYFADARQRFLRPGGRFVPTAVSLFVAPVDAPALFAQIEFWRTPRHGLTLEPAREWAVNTGYPAALDAGALLAPGTRAAGAVMATAAPEPFRCELSVACERDGMLHGIAGWFEAELAPGIAITNAPGATPRIARRHVYLPIDRAVPIRAGDTINIGVHADPIEAFVSWSVEAVPRDGGARSTFRHSTLRGMLISREGLRLCRPDARPRLTRRGQARRTVLDLCDGVRTLQEIEQTVYDRHPGVFRSRADASGFVAEVVTRYSE